MRNLLTFILIALSFVAGFFIRNIFVTKTLSETPIQQPRPLEKYSIENLSKTNIEPGKLTIKEKLYESEKFTSYLFEFEFNPNLASNILKKTTGMLNMPSDMEGSKPSSNTPVLLMIRGFVDQKMYVTGMGTKNAANYFSENGFITIAPDFLGYGGSDQEVDNIFESRFQTYTTIISLVNTLEHLKDNNDAITFPNNLIVKLSSSTPIFIWSHSNGGQIALTILEITGKTYPTVLWAPVTKPFPYSILYYTDEANDGGKFLRKKLSEFEELYDSDKYSLTNYLDKINAPIHLDQGTADESVLPIWSDNFTSQLKDLNKDVTYTKYPGANHNMQPKWDDVIKEDNTFYKKFF